MAGPAQLETFPSRAAVSPAFKRRSKGRQNSMAHLWLRHDGDDWSAMLLAGHAIDISVHPPRILAEAFRLAEDTRVAVIPVAAEDPPTWVLLVAAGSDVRVNGFAPVAGLRGLQDPAAIW